MCDTLVTSSSAIWSPRFAFQKLSAALFYRRPPLSAGRPTWVEINKRRGAK